MPYKDMQKKKLNALRRKTDPVISVRDKLYNVWRGIKKRCNNPNHYAYDSYGGRGIKLSKEWENFENFYSWSLANGYKVGLTLDRIDNDSDYSPVNCRWATWKEQGNNRRTNIFITFNEKTQTLTMWADELGISTEMLWSRLNKYNWPLEVALTAPKGSINKHNRKEFIKHG